PIRRSTGSTLFPYTTLFRSGGGDERGRVLRLALPAPGQKPGVPPHAPAAEFYGGGGPAVHVCGQHHRSPVSGGGHRPAGAPAAQDRKSTRLNSSHVSNSYAV